MPAHKVASEQGLQTFLSEEIADARLRTDQLKAQVNEAMSMVEKSDHRDHFFEIAGHLIYGIPDTLMRVEKSLDATAMALAKWTYDTLKDDLRPEKADQLDEALKDVRTRRVRRRTKWEALMNTHETREALNRIASAIEKTGYVNTAAIAQLVARLEAGAARTASAKREIVDIIRDISAAMGSADPSLRPSRMTVASVLRRVMGEGLDVRQASDAKRSRFEEGVKSDPTEAMSEEDAEAWESNKDKYKDKFKKEALSNRFAEDDEDDAGDTQKAAYDWKA